MILNQNKLNRAFDFNKPQPLSTPQIQVPQEPFVFGQGGARLTPEQLLAQREIANQKMQSNFSPVGSVWEGLGRVSNNVLGAIESNELDKQQQLINADKQAMMSSILGTSGVNPVLARAMAGSDKGLAGLAGKIYESTIPKAPPQSDLQKKYDWLVSQGKTKEAESLVNKETSDIQYVQAQNSDGTLSLIGIRPDGSLASQPNAMAMQGMQGGLPPPTKPVGKLTPITGGQMPQASGSFPR